MARKKKIEEDGLAEYVEQGRALEAQSQEIAPYLAGTPYNYDRLISEIEYFNHQHMRSGFEVGCRLMALKAALPYGEFGPQVLERVGFTLSYASRLMAFARKVVELAKSSKGALDFDKLKSMDRQKIMLLGELAEESPEELEATGTIGGKTLDEWDGKSRKELADTVRNLQARVNKGRQEILDQQARTEKKQQQLDNIFAGDSNAICLATTEVTTMLRGALDGFATVGVNGNADNVSPAAQSSIVALRAELRKFYDTFITMIDERFPEVHEVPEDFQFDDSETLLKAPPAKGKRGSKAKVIDASN